MEHPAANNKTHYTKMCPTVSGCLSLRTTCQEHKALVQWSPRLLKALQNSTLAQNTRQGQPINAKTVLPGTATYLQGWDEVLSWCREYQSSGQCHNHIMP